MHLFYFRLYSNAVSLYEFMAAIYEYKDSNENDSERGI